MPGKWLTLWLWEGQDTNPWDHYGVTLSSSMAAPGQPALGLARGRLGGVTEPGGQADGGGAWVLRPQ